MSTVNFYDFLKEGDSMADMPRVSISKRTTDRFLVYNKQKTRVDRMAETVYGDSSYYRLIMWANPEYELEFDIQDDVVLRIPYPLLDVLQEVQGQIEKNKNV